MPTFILRSTTFVVVSLITHHGAVAEDDLTELNGRWVVIIATMGGKPITDAVGEAAIFTDGTAVQENLRGRETFSGTITCDKSHKPATIDLRENGRIVNRGVYVLRGETLEICWGFDKRPDSLDSSKDKTFVHFIFARKGQ